jgi:hypothetical protein
MERLPIDGFHIEGFPDAIKVIKVTGPQAQRLSDLALHRSDLDFADECLNSINAMSGHPSSEFLQQALWRTAIIHFAKCFGQSSSRGQLNYDNIYKGEPPAARAAFDFFKALRDKHVAHDENALAQSLPGALLNKGDKPYKIEKIVTLSVVVRSLDQEAYSNLKLLIEKARCSIEGQYSKLCEQLTEQLEAEDYSNLLAREELAYTAPTIDEINRPRPR